MPAVMNIAGNLALGGALVFVARRSPALHRELVNWALLFLIAFEALVVTPIATYLFRFYPQWSMLYGFDPQIFTHLDSYIGLFSLLAVLGNFAAAVLGYVAAREGLLRNKPWLFYGPMAAGGAIFILVLLAYAQRVAFIGDYDTFWQGNADLFLLRVPGWVGILLYAGGGGFVYWVHKHFSRHDPSFV